MQTEWERSIQSRPRRLRLEWVRSLENIELMYDDAESEELKVRPMQSVEDVAEIAGPWLETEMGLGQHLQLYINVTSQVEPFLRLYNEIPEFHASKNFYQICISRRRETQQCVEFSVANLHRRHSDQLCIRYITR